MKKQNFFSKFSINRKFSNRSNFFCGDLRCLICFLKDAETCKLSLDKVSRWRHVEAGLISSLFSEKYDFWSKFMVLKNCFSLKMISKRFCITLISRQLCPKSQFKTKKSHQIQPTYSLYDIEEKDTPSFSSTKQPLEINW